MSYNARYGELGINSDTVEPGDNTTLADIQDVASVYDEIFVETNPKGYGSKTFNGTRNEGTYGTTTEIADCADCIVRCTCNEDNGWYSSSSHSMLSGAETISVTTKRVYALTNNYDSNPSTYPAKKTCYHKKNICNDGYFYYNGSDTPRDAIYTIGNRQTNKRESPYYNCWKIEGCQQIAFEWNTSDGNTGSFTRDAARTGLNDPDSDISTPLKSDIPQRNTAAAEAGIQCFIPKWPTHIYYQYGTHQSGLETCYDITRARFVRDKAYSGEISQLTGEYLELTSSAKDVSDRFNMGSGENYYTVNYACGDDGNNSNNHYVSRFKLERTYYNAGTINVTRGVETSFSRGLSYNSSNSTCSSGTMPVGTRKEDNNRADMPTYYGYSDSDMPVPEAIGNCAYTTTPDGNTASTSVTGPIADINDLAGWNFTDKLNSCTGTCSDTNEKTTEDLIRNAQGIKADTEPGGTSSIANDSGYITLYLWVGKGRKYGTSDRADYGEGDIYGYKIIKQEIVSPTNEYVKFNYYGVTSYSWGTYGISTYNISYDGTKTTLNTCTGCPGSVGYYNGRPYTDYLEPGYITKASGPDGYGYRVVVLKGDAESGGKFSTKYVHILGD